MTRRHGSPATPSDVEARHRDVSVGKPTVYCLLAAAFFATTAVVYAADGRFGPIFYLSAVAVPLWVVAGVRRLGTA